VVHDTDGNGFRNAWPWPERAEVVALGDSLTFGYGVTADEAWPSVLARARPDVRVVNLGLIGASTPQYRRVWEVFGAPLRPRVVLVGVFPQNDFWDAGLFRLWERSGGSENFMVWRDSGQRTDAELQADADAGLKGSIVQRLRSLAAGSEVARLVRTAWTRYRRAEMVYRFPDGGVLRLDPEDFADKTQGAVAGRREYRVVHQALLELDRHVREHGARTLVLLLPGKEEVHLPLLDVPMQDPAADLRKSLVRHGIDHLDLGPLFRARASAGQRLFYEHDGHPNAEGYALIAEGVLAHLQTREYLPASAAAR
jgi:lysophospholipase L1-like esterase